MALTKVYSWPANLLVQGCQWDDAAGILHTQSLTDGATYGGFARPRARVKITGRSIDRRIYSELEVFIAKMGGGENLALLYDHNRTMYDFDSVYQAPPQGVQGQLTWQGSSGSDYYWTGSGGGQKVWLGALTLISGGGQGGNTITVGNAAPNAVFQIGHKIFIEDRRYVINKEAQADGAGQVTLQVSPVFYSAVNANSRIIYPGDVGLFVLTAYEKPLLDQDNKGNWSMSFLEVFESEYPGGLTYF